MDSDRYREGLSIMLNCGSRILIDMAEPGIRRPRNCPSVTVRKLPRVPVNMILTRLLTGIVRCRGGAYEMSLLVKGRGRKVVELKAVDQE